MKNLVLVSAFALGFAGLSSMATAAPTVMSDAQLNGVAAGLTWNFNQGNIAFNDLVDGSSSTSSSTMTVDGSRNTVSQSGGSLSGQSNGSYIGQTNYVGLGFPM